MVQYTAKATTAMGRTFHLTKGEEFIGLLNYDKWYSFNARIELASETTYSLEQTGFWGTSVALKEGDKLLMNCLMNWKGHIILESFLDEKINGYKLRNLNLLSGKMVLLDTDENEVMSMQPDNKLFETHRCLQISLSDELASHPKKELMMITALHCANHLLTDGL